MERITASHLNGLRSRIAYNFSEAVALAQRQPETHDYFGEADVQRGSITNGYAWRFSCAVKRTDGEYVESFALTAKSARELYSKMDAFNDALAVMRRARWQYDAQQKRVNHKS
jgi:hypothetical protein